MQNWVWRRVWRGIGWGAIAAPPSLIIVLSLLPADQLILWLYGSVLGLCSLTALLFTVVQAHRSQSGPRWKKSRQRATLAFCLVVSVLSLNWPMRLAFILSRPALNQAAQQLLAGDPVATPRRIGLFRIAAAELFQNPSKPEQIPSLWTDLGSGGDLMGFVQSGPGKPPFIMWSHMRLDRDWQFIYRAE